MASLNAPYSLWRFTDANFLGTGACSVAAGCGSQMQQRNCANSWSKGANNRISSNKHFQETGIGFANGSRNVVERTREEGKTRMRRTATCGNPQLTTRLVFSFHRLKQLVSVSSINTTKQGGKNATRNCITKRSC